MMGDSFFVDILFFYPKLDKLNVLIGFNKKLNKLSCILSTIFDIISELKSLAYLIVSKLFVNLLKF